MQNFRKSRSLHEIAVASQDLSYRSKHYKLGWLDTGYTQRCSFRILGRQKYMKHDHLGIWTWPHIIYIEPVLEAIRKSPKYYFYYL